MPHSLLYIKYNSVAMFQMMEEARREGELKMIEARNKLVNDLARLHTRVDEFCDYGELSMIQHYFQDTRSVQKKLMELANQVKDIGDTSVG